MKIRTLASKTEQDNRTKQQTLFRSSPVFANEKVAQVGLFQRRQELSKMLFLNDLYQKFLSVHGVIMEFGTRWGKI